MNNDMSTKPKRPAIGEEINNGWIQSFFDYVDSLRIGALPGQRVRHDSRQYLFVPTSAPGGASELNLYWADISSKDSSYVYRADIKNFDQTTKESSKLVYAMSEMHNASDEIPEGSRLLCTRQQYNGDMNYVIVSIPRIL